MDHETFDRLFDARIEARNALEAHFEQLRIETLGPGGLTVREGGLMDDDWRARYRQLKATEDAAIAALLAAYHD